MKRIWVIISFLMIVIVIVPIIITYSFDNICQKINHKSGGIENFEAVINSNEEKEENEENDLNLGPIIKVFISDKNELVEMPLEEYIKGVISAEMPAEFELEALKAQAVASRTYAYTRMKIFGGAGCSNHKDADICTDSTHCQAWISKEARIESWGSINAKSYWDKIESAVNETNGRILYYNSEPVMYPLFFSTSSGKTENSGEVFKYQYPYLKSVISPNEDVAPKFVSKVVIPINEFIKKFYESEFKIKIGSNIQTQIKIIDRTDGGSVKNIKVGDKNLLGTDVRKILGLNSANFNITFSKNDVTFLVTGYGHGVGMSQWGANVMAKEGKKYDEILTHYYSDTQIKFVYEN